MLLEGFPEGVHGAGEHVQLEHLISVFVGRHDGGREKKNTT